MCGRVGGWGGGGWGWGWGQLKHITSSVNSPGLGKVQRVGMKNFRQICTTSLIYKPTTDTPCRIPCVPNISAMTAYSTTPSTCHQDQLPVIFSMLCKRDNTHKRFEKLILLKDVQYTITWKF